MPSCISYFMQFIFLLPVYLASSLLSKYDVVVIPNSILGAKEKANWQILRLSSHLYRYFASTSDDIWSISPPFLHLFYECLYSDVCAGSIFLANSLVNPIIYALRMPGFREGLLQLVYTVPDLIRIAPANLLLRNL